MNELWISVVGQDDEDRIVCQGTLKEVEAAVYEHSEEVICDADKYFMLNTPVRSYTFYSYRDYVALNLGG